MSDANTPAISPSDCPRCGTTREGAYCSACGQPRTQPLGLQRILLDAFGQVADLDFRWVRTARDLTLRPGRMLRHYFAGDRTTWGNPIRYLFINVTVYVAVLQLMLQFQPFGLGLQGLDQVPITLFTAATAILAYISWLYLLVTAAAQRWLFRSAGLTFAEHYTGMLFLYGHIALLVTPIVLTGLWRPAVAQLVAFAYLSWQTMDLTGQRSVAGFLKCIVVFGIHFLAGTLTMIGMISAWALITGTPLSSLSGTG
jgi:Protein of unknown function (DUF3667)